jgi:hypothetical protein
VLSHRGALTVGFDMCAAANPVCASDHHAGYVDDNLAAAPTRFKAEEPREETAMPSWLWSDAPRLSPQMLGKLLAA